MALTEKQKKQYQDVLDKRREREAPALGQSADTSAMPLPKVWTPDLSTEYNRYLEDQRKKAITGDTDPRFTTPGATMGSRMAQRQQRAKAATTAARQQSISEQMQKEYREFLLGKHDPKTAGVTDPAAQLMQKQGAVVQAGKRQAQVPFYSPNGIYQDLQQKENRLMGMQQGASQYVTRLENAEKALMAGKKKLEALRPGTLEYQAAAGEMEKLWANYQAAYEGYQNWEKDYNREYSAMEAERKRRLGNWEKTIREAAEIEYDLKVLEEKIQQQERLDIVAAHQPGYIGTGDSSEMAALKQEKARLTEELEWSQRFRKDALVEQAGSPEERAAYETIFAYGGDAGNLPEMFSDMNEIYSLPPEVKEAFETVFAAENGRREAYTVQEIRAAEKLLHDHYRYDNGTVMERKIQRLFYSYERFLNAQRTQKADEAFFARTQSGWGKAGIYAENALLPVYGVGNAIVGGVGSAVDAVAGIINPDRTPEGYATRDPNKGFYRIADQAERVKGYTRGQIEGEDPNFWRNAGGFAYGGAISAGENGARIALGYLTGTSWVSLALAAMGSYSDSYRDSLRRGGTELQAAAYGGLSAALEVVTEKVSLDHLLDDKWTTKTLGKKIMDTLLVSPIIEMSEEEASYFGGLLADALIMQDKSERNLAIQRYIEQGMSREEAQKRAVKDMWIGAGETLVESYISSGLMTGTKHISSGMRDSSRAKELEQAMAEGKLDDGFIRQTIEAGLALDPKGRSYKLAEAMQKKVDAGQEITARELGQLWQANEAAIEEGLTYDPKSEIYRKSTELSQRESGRLFEALDRRGETETVHNTDIEKAAQNLGEEYRNSFIRNYDGQTDVETYEKAYRAFALEGQIAAQQGKDTYRDSVKRYDAFADVLSESARTEAYAIGKTTAQAEIETKISQGAGAVAKTGTVHFDGDRSKLTQTQKVNLSSMEVISRALGVDIHVFESQEDESGRRLGRNGWYDVADGSIHIDLHAGTQGKDTMLFTAAHELTHYIRAGSEDSFQRLALFLEQEYGKAGASTEGLVQERIQRAKRQGRNLSYEEAYEEMVADSMETMLADGKIIEKLQKLKGQNKSLWQRIKDFVGKLAKKIRKAYEGLRPDSKEGKLVQEMAKTAESLEKLFYEGLKLVKDGHEGTQKNTTSEGSIKMQLRTVDGTEVVWIEENILKQNKGLPEHKFIAEYIAEHIGEVYTILESGQKVYIGKDLPSEYTQSEYTKWLKRNKPDILKVKNRALPALGEMIEIATNRQWGKTKHTGSKDAKYGMYRYDSRFGFPVKSPSGKIVGAKIFTVELLICNASDGKKYLYDIVDIKKDTTHSAWLSQRITRAASFPAAQKGSASSARVAHGAQNVKQKKPSERYYPETEEDREESWEDAYALTAEEEARGKIYPGMDDAKRAAILAKKKIAPPTYVGAETVTAANIKKLKGQHMSSAAKLLRTIGERCGIFNSNYENKDIELKFAYSKGSIKESQHHQSKRGGTAEEFGKMLSILPEICANAVEIHIETDRYAGTERADPSLKEMHILLGAFRDGDRIVPVQLEVKEYYPEADAENKLYVAVTIKTEAGVLPGTTTVSDNGNSTPGRPASEYTVAEILGAVKDESGDLVKYFPDSMLTEEQMTAKKKALAKDKRRLERMKPPPVEIGIDAEERDLFQYEWLSENDEFLSQEEKLVAIKKLTQKGKYAAARMQTVDTLVGKEFIRDGKLQIDQVEQFFKETGGTVENPQLGDVEFKIPATMENADFSNEPGQGACIAAVPKVLSNGAVVDFQYNWKDGGYDIATVAAPVTIGGTPYMMGVILKRGNEGGNFYVHEVMAQKEGAMPFSNGTRKGAPGGDTSSMKRIFKKILDVKGRYALGKLPKIEKSLDYQKSLAQKRLTKLRDNEARQKERADREKTQREETQWRQKAKKAYEELSKYLLTESKTRHVPPQLQKAVAELLSVINLDTVGANERIAALDKKLRETDDPEKRIKISESIAFINKLGDSVGKRIKNLREAYDAIKNSDDPTIAAGHDDLVSGYIQQIAEKIGDTSLRDMNAEQLQLVYEAAAMTLKTIRDANKTFKTMRGMRITEIKSRVETELRRQGTRTEYQGKIAAGMQTYRWNILKPVYAFRKLGSETMMKLYAAMKEGEGIAARDVTEARDFRLEIQKKYGYDSWNHKAQHTFTSTDGKKFYLTLEEILSVYAMSKREQALGHLLRDGFVFNKAVERAVPGKKGKKQKTDVTAYGLDMELITEIAAVLSEKQKAYADEMQDYLSSVMGEKGNEVSLAMYDVKLFKEKNYFPIQTAREYMAKQAGTQQEPGKIKDSGFTKSTVEKAGSPIVLSPFMNVWSGHVTEMSQYHALVLPMEDFYRVYGYVTHKQEFDSTDSHGDTVHEVRGADSVQAMITRVHGSVALDYINQLLQDLNGGIVTDHRASFMDRMIAKTKKASVLSKISVWIQQCGSLPRAWAHIHPKYFIGPKIKAKEQGKLWAEVKKYAPVAIIKEMGYFDTGVGMTMQEYILSNEYEGIGAKAKAVVTDSQYRDEMLGKMAGLMDEATWCSIWQAVKRELAATHPELEQGSEGFLKAAGKRFDEIVSLTQVYDSVFSRDAFSRSKEGTAKMLMAYMPEPVTIVNMIDDALREGKKGTKEGRKYCRRAIASVAASITVTSMLQALAAAMKDEDEDESYLEKYIEALVGNLLDGFNPLTYFPFIRDIYSVVNGYDVERTDMSLFEDIVQAIRKLSDEDLSGYRKGAEVVGAVCNLFGIPLKNIEQDMRGIWNTGKLFLDKESKAKTTGDGILQAMREGLPPVADWFVPNVYSESGIQKAYTQKTFVGRISWEKAAEALNALRASKGEEPYTENQLYWLRKKWDAGYKGYKNTDELDLAVLSGDAEAIAACVKELEDHSDKKPTEPIKAAILRIYKDSLLPKEERNEVYGDQTITRAKAAQLLRDLAGLKDYEIFSALERAEYSVANSGETGFTVYGDIYKAMTAGEDVTSLYKALESEGFMEDQIRSESKKLVTAAYKDGRLTKEETTAILGKYYDMTGEKELYEYFGRADYEKSGYGDSYTPYKDVYAAVADGKDISKLVGELVSHGFEEGQVYSQAVGEVSRLYQEGELSDTQAAQLVAKYGRTKETLSKANEEVYKKQYGYVPEAGEQRRLTEHEVYWKTEEWKWKKANPNSSDSYSKYSQFYRAVESGKDLKKTIQYYQSHGMSKEQLAGAITDRYKEQYLKLRKEKRYAEAANLAARMLTAWGALGYSRSEKQQDMKQWEREN